jgi:N-acetyl sugar amidotransferase
MRNPGQTITGGMACQRCILTDRVERDLEIDASGICHHCRRYDRELSIRVVTGINRQARFNQIIDKIKLRGRGRDYDCVIGVSGGVDSTYVAHLVSTCGLRPLAVHVDNGWNSELAVGNIERALSRLRIDLYTHVLDWEEFRDLQVAFLRASTPDGEIPTDHAISAVLWKTAARLNIRYIISGMNFATEALSIPHWAYGHSDWRYIQDIHRRFGSIPLRSYPHFPLWRLAWWNAIRRIRTVSILNYIDYRKTDAVSLLKSELGWIDYGGKHHESIYTRFFQGHILPRKFGIDKRYGHLSDLINAKQISREEALAELERPPYPLSEQEEDRLYVLRKLRLSADEFEQIMSSPPRTFREFHNSFNTIQVLRRAVNHMRASGWYPR